MRRSNFALLLLISIGLATPAQAIVVCHDYTLYRLSGKDPRPKDSPGKQGSDVGTLLTYLREHGYRSFPMTTAVENSLAKVQSLLKPGDVIIIRDDHSGYVNEKGKIDHFIQAEGTSFGDAKYNADELPPHESLNGKIGGLYRDETVEQFLDRPYRKTPRIVEVWRKART